MAELAQTHILNTTEDLTGDYSVIGIRFGYALRSAEGCNNTLNVIQVFNDALNRLNESAIAAGADAVIGVSFLQRDTTAQRSCDNTKPATEVYAWGTAVKRD